MRRRAFIGGSVGLFGAATCWVCGRGDDGPVPVAVTLQVELSRQALPADATSRAWAIVRVGTVERDAATRPPIDVGLVMDTSSSMAGEAIAAARRAASEVVGTLRDGDRLTLVTFDSRATVVLDAVQIDDDARTEALARIEGIVARGTTDLAAGLHAAIDRLEPHVAGGRVTRLVLLGDGVANDPTNVPWAAARAAGLGMTITALGFGVDYDEVLLAALARDSGGSFFHLDDPEQIAEAFAGETRRLQGIVAKDLSLSLVAGPRCDLAHVDGIALGAGVRTWNLALGDLSDGEQRVVAVELDIQGHRPGATAELLDVTLAWVDPATGDVGEPLLQFVSAPVSDDEAVLAAAMQPQVEREVERVQAAALTLRALEATRNGDTVGSGAMLRDAIPQLAAAAERLDDGDLADQVEDMRALKSELERAAKAPQAGKDVDGEPVDAAPVQADGVTKARAYRRANASALQNFQPRAVAR